MLPTTPHEFVVAPYSRQYAHRVYKIKEIREKNEKIKEKDILASRANSEFYIPVTTDNSKVHHSRRSFGIVRPVSAGKPRPTSSSGYSDAYASGLNVSRSLDLQREELAHQKINESLKRVIQEEKSKKFEPKPWIPPRASSGDCTDLKSKHRVVNKDKVAYGIVNKAWKRSPWPTVAIKHIPGQYVDAGPGYGQASDDFDDMNGEDERYPPEYYSTTPHVVPGNLSSSANVRAQASIRSRPLLHVATELGSPESEIAQRTRARSASGSIKDGAGATGGYARSVASTTAVSATGLTPKHKSHYVLTGVLIDRQSDQENFRHGILLVPKGSSAMDIARAVEQQFNFRGISDLTLTTQSGYGGQISSSSISLGTMEEYPLITDATTFVAFTGGEPLDLSTPDNIDGTQFVGGEDSMIDSRIEQMPSTGSVFSAFDYDLQSAGPDTVATRSRLSVQPSRAPLEKHPKLESPEKRSVFDFQKKAEKEEAVIKEELQAKTWDPVIHNDRYESARETIRQVGVFSAPSAELNIAQVTGDAIRSVAYSSLDSPHSSPVQRDSPPRSVAATVQTSAGLVATHSYLPSPSRGQMLWEDTVKPRSDRSDFNGDISIVSSAAGQKSSLNNKFRSSSARQTPRFRQQTVSSIGKKTVLKPDTRPSNESHSSHSTTGGKAKIRAFFPEDDHRDNVDIDSNSVHSGPLMTKVPTVEALKLDDFLKIPAVVDYLAPMPDDMATKVTIARLLEGGLQSDIIAKLSDDTPNQADPCVEDTHPDDSTLLDNDAREIQSMSEPMQQVVATTIEADSDTKFPSRTASNDSHAVEIGVDQSMSNSQTPNEFIAPVVVQVQEPVNEISRSQIVPPPGAVPVKSPGDSLKDRIQNRLAAIRQTMPKSDASLISSTNSEASSLDPSNAISGNSASQTHRTRSASFESPENPQIIESYRSSMGGAGQSRRASTNSVPSSNIFTSEFSKTTRPEQDSARVSLTSRWSISGPVEMASNDLQQSDGSFQLGGSAPGNAPQIDFSSGQVTEKTYSSRGRAQLDLRDMLAND